MSKPAAREDALIQKIRSYLKRRPRKSKTSSIVG